MVIICLLVLVQPIQYYSTHLYYMIGHEITKARVELRMVVNFIRIVSNLSYFNLVWHVKMAANQRLYRSDFSMIMFMDINVVFSSQWEVASKGIVENGGDSFITSHDFDTTFM